MADVLPALPSSSKDCAQNEKRWQVQLRLRFESDAAAEIALNSLTPDAELNPHIVSRTMEVREAHLIIEMVASNAKLLRNSMNGIFDMLMLVDRVQTEFSATPQGKKVKREVS